MKRVVLLLVMIVAGASQIVRGQNVALKTNVLSDAFLNYYCPLKFLRANIKLGLIPFAGVSPKWLFWCHQTIHE